MKKEDIPYYFIVLAIMALLYRAVETKTSDKITIFEEGRLEQVEEQEPIVFRQKVVRDSQAITVFQKSNMLP